MNFTTRNLAKKDGLTLVEMLIALAILGVVVLSVTMTLVKFNTMGKSLSHRNRAVVEIQSVFDNMLAAVSTASRVDPKSVSSKLVLVSTNSSGYGYLQAWRIQSSVAPCVGSTCLQVSTDLDDAAETNASWSSPYNIAAVTDYKITSGEFLYCGYGLNNCYRFPDGNANRVWDGAGTDGSPVWVSLNAQAQGTALTSPDQARRVVLYNFTFSRSFGNPAVTRTMPNIVAKLGPRLVDPSPDGGAAWGSPLISTTSIGGTNTSFASDYNGISARLDPVRQRLMVVGQAPTGNQKVYILDRTGANIKDVSNGITSPVDVPTLNGRWLWDGVWENATTVLVADGSSDTNNIKVYEVRLTDGSVLGTWTIDTAFIPDGNLLSLAYDPKTPTVFYMLAWNASQVPKLYKLTKPSGNATISSAVTTYNLPAALVAWSSNDVLVDSLSGKFYILDNDITTSGSDKTCNLYRIDLASSTAIDATIKINVAKLTGSTQTGGDWNFTYDPDTNHVFFTEKSTVNKIWEFIPSQLLSPQS
ncbi:MAG TPA: prepilin-type N-terminal cleavage/methylation domain-containing protein [Coleofasciculaceae cyanobacterium]|jgi:prepilin-type N-terminal cleavage/methylation domain-containing protein